MKKSFYLLSALVALLCAYSCSDGNIGSSILDTKSSIIEDSSFVLTGTTVANSSVHARTSTQLVGQLNSPGYGTVNSDVVCQLMPAIKIDTTNTKEEWIDSCRITMCLATSGGFTGDNIAPMRMSVYELNKQLPEPIFSNFNPQGYYNTQELGSVSCSPMSATVCQETYSTSTSTWLEVRVPIPTDYAKRMLRLWKQNSEIFKDPNEFKQHFPGLYITHSFGSGRVMNYYTTELEVFYRQLIHKNDTTDTIQSNMQVYAASTPEVITNNNITLTPDEIVTEMVNNGDAILMGPAGYEVNVKFPIQEIIDKYKNNSKDGLADINSLELYIPAEEIANKYDVAPPEYILMVKKDSKDKFFEGDSLTNDKNSFYAKYDATNKRYAFTGLRDYVLNIIKNQNGIATDADVNLVLTPVDVTTYTQSSSYSYYYGSSQQTVVTKIAPSVAKPVLAKLRLDKAKIKIIYSKQSVF